MTEEELRKYIAWLKFYAYDDKDEYFDKDYKFDKNTSKKILNLIEKLQKENEELNKENNRQHGLLTTIHDKNIPKQTIRDKIEELLNRKELEEEEYDFSIVDSFAIQVLQELLGE